MNKSINTSKSHRVKNQNGFFRLGVFAAVLVAAGGVTAIAKYELRASGRPTVEKQGAVPNPLPGKNTVTVEVGGKKLSVNAQTLQQGPLTPEQAQQIADALKNNQSTDGLVQVQNPDGSVSVDLQGRFQNVAMARKNDDGSVSQACVDNPAAAAAFLSDTSKPATAAGPGRIKKVAVIEK